METCREQLENFTLAHLWIVFTRVWKFPTLLVYLMISLSFECCHVLRQECNSPLLHVVQRLYLIAAKVIPGVLDLGHALSSLFGRLRSFEVPLCFSLYWLFSSLMSFQLGFSLGSWQWKTCCEIVEKKLLAVLMSVRQNQWFLCGTWQLWFAKLWHWAPVHLPLPSRPLMFWSYVKWCCLGESGLFAFT